MILLQLFALLILLFKILIRGLTRQVALLSTGLYPAFRKGTIVWNIVLYKWKNTYQKIPTAVLKFEMNPWIITEKVCSKFLLPLPLISSLLITEGCSTVKSKSRKANEVLHLAVLQLLAEGYFATACNALELYLT